MMMANGSQDRWQPAPPRGLQLKRRYYLTALVALAVAPARDSRAWGATGHDWIGTAADFVRTSETPK